MSTAYAASDVGVLPERPQRIGARLRQLAYIYVWLTFATSGIVFAEPAPHDLLMVGAMALLPLLGLVAFNRGLVLYLLLWGGIVVTGLIATTQAGVFDLPVKHVAIGAYLAASSVVIAGFVLDRPDANIRLIMSAYVFAALVAASTGLVGALGLVPGGREVFAADFGRLHGTFKDPNVLGAFLVPPLLYVLNVAIRSGIVRASFYVVAAPVLLLASLLAFSRGAWINLGVSLAVYVGLTLVMLAKHRERVRLVIYVMFACIFAFGLLIAALTVPDVSRLMEERASLHQYYDVGPEGRFSGQAKAVALVITHPMGIGGLEFARLYHKEDPHQVYLSMFLNAGWVGGTFYLALVLLTIWLGLRHVLKDRGGNGVSVVLVAAFVGMALEGIVIDSDHWRHFYLIMAMIWGMALAPRTAPWQANGRGP